jgi:hypothetical protein
VGSRSQNTAAVPTCAIPITSKLLDTMMLRICIREQQAASSWQ